MPLKTIPPEHVESICKPDDISGCIYITQGGTGPLCGKKMFSIKLWIDQQAETGVIPRNGKGCDGVSPYGGDIEYPGPPLDKDTKKGDKIIFAHPNVGSEHQCDMGARFLEVGKEYKLRDIQILESRIDVELELYAGTYWPGLFFCKKVGG